MQPKSEPTPPYDRAAGLKSANGRASYCKLQLQRSGDVPLSISEDPFDDDLGYGAAIHIVSTNVKSRLTWGILMAVLQGLWDFLVAANSFKESDLQGTFVLNAPETVVDDVRHCSCTMLSVRI